MTGAIARLAELFARARRPVVLLLRPKAGDTVRAAFTRLGSVSVRFA